MITNPETLPDDPVALKPIVVELCERHGQQISQLNSENTLLHEQIRLLRQLLFGKKSEKLPANSTAVHLPLFDLPEFACVRRADQGDRGFPRPQETRPQAAAAGTAAGGNHA